MNKKLYTLCAIAAAFVLAGCQKENNEEATTYVGPTHTVTFTAEKMIDTKTAIDTEGNGVVSYKWIEGDEERMHITESYTDGENTVKNGTTSIAMALSNDDKVATFTVTFTGNAPEGEVTYDAFYAGSVSNSGNPLIPASQNPLQNSFDPAADVLVADPIVKQARDASPTFKFNMTRKVSVNKLTLKGLTPNETISTVTFESDKQHSAYFVPGTGNYSPNSTKLTFTFTANNTIPASGEFPVYFTTAPVTDATFTVKVTTNAAVYEKTSAKKISFAVGYVRRFGIDLSENRTPITAGTVFTLVESDSDIVDGADYLIVGSYDLVYKAMAEQRTNNRNVSEVLTVDNNTITIDNSSSAHIFTLLDYGTDGFVFQDQADDMYLYGDGANGNYLKCDASIKASSYWTINFDSSSHHAIITNNNDANSAKPYLKYNHSGLFSCYGSSSTGTHYVYLYISTTTGGKQNPKLSFAPTEVELTLGDSFTAPTLITDPSGLSVTYSSDETSVATVDSSTGVVTILSAGTATITANFAGNDQYKAGSASYTITVNPVPSVLGLPFTETFDDCTGTMGWSGQAVANGDFKPDHSGWFYSNAYGAEGAARFGKTSGLGSAETPEIEYTGNATLTFKAGAWNGNSESTNLKLSVSSGSLYGDVSLSIPITSVTLVKGDWTEYTVYLKDLESPFTVTFEGNAASNSRFFLDDVSIVEGIVQPAAEFGATMSNTDNVLAAGGTKTINVTGNVAWTASVTGNATVTPASGAGIGSVTVSIPANTNSSTATYTATVTTTADVTPNSYQFTIMQDAAPSVVNESTEADPYTPAEAAELADELSGGTMADVFVYGIISKITTAFNSDYNNVSFDISIDGMDSGSQQFRIYRTAASSADDYVVGDAVEFKGTLTKYNNTYELAEGSTLIGQLHKPAIDPDGGTFTTSQSVSISAASGSTIRYTTNGNDPTSSSSVYSSTFSLTATTTVKAIAIKGILTTGVASATFTKSSGGVQTLYLESFGSTSSNTAFGSYSGYTATASMFSTSGNVNTHYSGDGKIGKNNLSGVNLSSGYTGASGQSGCWHTGTANTQATILQISNINIEGYNNLSLSFGALGGNSSHKINVYYKIDNGSEVALITNGSINNSSWTLLSQAISGTGSSLTLIFKHTPTKAWTIRMDDIKVVGSN